MMKAKFDLDRFRTANEGAVAPLIAVALFGLIGAAGIAFDYSRLVTLDTELQNAADQGALAAAGQLNGKPNATRYAEEAASNLVSNVTRMANDGSTPLITIASVVFYADKDKTQVVVRDDASSTDDANAHYVQVTVGSRSAFYALTPVVGAFSSGPINAAAFAGLGSAVCKVPPVMMCNPKETTGDPDFTTADYVGKGILLTGDGSYAPGNFGFLATGGNGANDLKAALGLVNVPGDCQPITGVSTEPGDMNRVFDYLNTRFDVYANGLNNPCDKYGTACPPSANTRKDLATDWNGKGGLPDWTEPTNPYKPPAQDTAYTAATWPSGGIAPMGYPRDICHALVSGGTCAGGRVGNGVWDSYAYFRSHPVNYPTAPTAQQMIDWFGSSQPTRYRVYRYEMEHAAALLQSENTTCTNGNGKGSKSCTSYGVPAEGAGVVPGGGALDRRVISAAVVNCRDQGIAGRKTGVAVVRWIDAFLVEPAYARSGGRTANNELYIEVIGETGSAGSGTASQTVRRDTPYLIE